MSYTFGNNNMIAYKGLSIGLPANFEVKKESRFWRSDDDILCRCITALLSLPRLIFAFRATMYCRNFIVRHDRAEVFVSLSLSAEGEEAYDMKDFLDSQGKGEPVELKRVSDVFDAYLYESEQPDFYWTSGQMKVGDIMILLQSQGSLDSLPSSRKIIRSIITDIESKLTEQVAASDPSPSATPELD